MTGPPRGDDPGPAGSVTGAPVVGDGPGRAEAGVQAARAVRLAVRAATRDVPCEALVHVAVSGGPDSLALLAGALAVAPAGGWRVGLLTVDHGWRPGSGQVAAAVAAAGLAWGSSPVRVLRAGIGPRSGAGGPEAAARTARYALLDDASSRDCAVAVLLGHTLDDQAEQVLLGLARGSGTRSLSGMPAVRGSYRRPLLGLRRETVQAAAPTWHGDLARGLPGLPWRDPSNVDPHLLRARVRASALPALEAALGPGSVEGLARTADLLREDCAALDAWADRVVAELDALARASGGAGGEVGVVDVPVAPLETVPGAVRTRVLRLLAARAGAGALTTAHLAGLDALVTRWRGQGPLGLPGGVAASRARDSAGSRLRFRPGG